MKEIGLYIHIPFCKQKCYYCDFCSYSIKENLQAKYISSAIKEIDHIENKNDYEVKTIYIGGGTPSIIDSKKIKELLYHIKNNFYLKDGAEITIEANPGTIDFDKAKDYKEAGINRISLGLQTSNDELLKEIGRIHNYGEFEKAYECVSKAGFTNVNVDLMIGLPNQTIEDVIDTLEKIISKNPKHISVYSLIVEPETVMEARINNGTLALPDEELERDMYWTVKKVLEQNEFYQYEISNFAKTGFESKHNMDCWKQKEYIGIGVAAHSYLNRIRFSNTTNVEEYIKNIELGNYKGNIIIHEKQNKDDMMKEYMILGLRKTKGVEISSFEQKFNVNPLKIFKEEIQKMVKKKFLEVGDNYIRLTQHGIDFANIVWEEFV